MSFVWSEANKKCEREQERDTDTQSVSKCVHVFRTLDRLNANEQWVSEHQVGITCT